MEVPLACSVRVPGVQEGGDHSKGVWRDRQKKGNDIGIAKSPHYSRE